MDEYTRTAILGEGTYGIVYKATHKATGEVVAIKQLKTLYKEHGIPATAMREISLLKEVVHPNIVHLQRVLMDEGKLSLVFEYLALDLKVYLNRLMPSQYLPEKQVKLFLYQVLKGILFCHQRRILHRDMKPQNLLVATPTCIKIADFGLGRAVSIPVRRYTHEIITLWYRAPEILLGARNYYCHVDIWSIGCIFAEMASKKVLFRGDSEIGQLLRIFQILTTPTEATWPGVSTLPDYKDTFPMWKNYRLPSQPQVSNINVEGVKLLGAMLTYNPTDRINAQDALQHQYFADLDPTMLPSYAE